MVVAGHPLAAQAGFQEAGGNAIDAGGAVGLAINVLESEMTCFAGVAPSMIRMGANGVVQNFVGVGPWPRALDAEYFHKHQGGLVPEGILNTVVPGSPESRNAGPAWRSVKHLSHATTRYNVSRTRNGAPDQCAPSAPTNRIASYTAAPITGAWPMPSDGDIPSNNFSSSNKRIVCITTALRTSTG